MGRMSLARPWASPAAYRATSADKAVTFAAASSQYVSLPAAGLPTGNNPWSLLAAVKVSALPGSSQVICAFGTSATRQLACIVLNATGALASTFGGDTAATAITTNAWHLLHATWDGTTLTMYIDGASVKTATPGALNIAQLAIAAIGARNDVSTFASGTIDEVAFFGTCLSSTRVTAHWNAFNAGTGMGTTRQHAHPRQWRAHRLWVARMGEPEHVAGALPLHQRGDVSLLPALHGRQ